MKNQFKKIYIERDIINYGEKCNIITFSEDLFNEYQLNALSKQYEKLGFLKCACKYKDDNVDIYYYTTNLISISQYFGQASINKTEFVSIIKTICQSIKLCSNYAYFHKNNLVIDEELIYIDSKDKSIHIMYVPTSNLITNDVVYDLKKAIINLINNNLVMNSGQESFAQEILEGLRNDKLNIDEIVKVLDDIINKSDREDSLRSKIEKVKPIIEPIKIEEFKPESSTYDMEKNHKKNKKSNKGIKGFFKKVFSTSQDEIRNYNDSTNYNNFVNNNISYQGYNDGSDDTVILGCNQTSRAYLIDDNENYGEKIIINKDTFVIGRLKSVVDYEITNKTVGKTHAKFIKQDNKYYLVDLESKNGTYINSTKLMPNSLYEVEDGASIVFSNVKYTFNIEK